MHNDYAKLWSIRAVNYKVKYKDNNKCLVCEGERFFACQTFFAFLRKNLSGGTFIVQRSAYKKVTKKLKKGLDKCDEILYSNQRTDLKVNFKEI